MLPGRNCQGRYSPPLKTGFSPDCLRVGRRSCLRFIRELRGKPDANYQDALKYLSECLYAATGRPKTIILIDEYDVPLENAFFSGFYNRMIALLRSLFESALKTNENLEFAVVTGCLRNQPGIHFHGA